MSCFLHMVLIYNEIVIQKGNKTMLMILLGLCAVIYIIPAINKAAEHYVEKDRKEHEKQRMIEKIEKSIRINGK